MAERRMFAKTIIDSDAFLDMPPTTQNLYFHLGMRADDDGFVNSPKKIMRVISASEDDLKLLIAKKFIIPFENGVVVIKHWRIHNYIRKDTYKPTNYKEQLATLEYDENNAYTQAIPTPATVRDESVDGTSTQVRLGKDRLGKVSKEIYGTFNNEKLTHIEYEKLIDEYGQGRANKAIEFLSSYREEKGYKNKSDYLSIKRWVFDAAEKKPSSNPFKDYYLKEIENEQNRSGLSDGDHQNILPRILPPDIGD